MKRCGFGATEKRGYTSTPLGRSDGERPSAALWQMFRSARRKTLMARRKKASTFSMTASSVVAEAATKPAKFQNIRRFASWNEEKTLFLFLFLLFIWPQNIVQWKHSHLAVAV